MKKVIYLFVTLFISTHLFAGLYVNMYSTPVSISPPSVNGVNNHDIDLDNNGIDDVSFIAQKLNAGFFTIGLSPINNQFIESEYVAVSAHGMTIPYMCSARFNSGLDWGNSFLSLNAPGSRDALFPGKGQRYIAIRKVIPVNSTYKRYIYGWIKAEVSADSTTLTVYGFAFNDVQVGQEFQPDIVAGEGECIKTSIEKNQSAIGQINMLNNKIEVTSDFNKSIRVFDIKGSLISEKNVASGYIEMPLDNLGSGLYFIEVKSGISIRKLRFLKN